MPRFVLLYSNNVTYDFKTTSGMAPNVIDFLETVRDPILESDEWVVYKVSKAIHKDELLHSGELDEVMEEP